MRPISVFENPVAAPGVCAKCGCQDRDWFVDLGFDLEMNQYSDALERPCWLDGVVYLCCECINSLHDDLLRRLEQFEIDHTIEVPYHGRTDVADDAAQPTDNYSGADSDDQGNVEDDSTPEPKLAVGFQRNTTSA